MERIFIGVDYVTIKFENSKETQDKAITELIEVLKLPKDSFFQKKGRKRVRYFEEFGFSIIVRPWDIEIQFHSSFFAFYGFEAFKVIEEKIQTSFKRPTYIKRIDIAQDYETNDSIFPNSLDHINFKFKVTKSEYIDLKTKKSESVYLRGCKKRWVILAYDKTKELKVNKSSNKRKFESYKAKGYLDMPVKRLELRLHAEYCSKILHILCESDEVTLCEKLLKKFYSGHRCYLNHGKFDNHNTNREKEWPLWSKLFNKLKTLPAKNLPNTFSTRIPENKTVQELYLQFLRTVARTNISSVDLIRYLHANIDQVEKEIDNFRVQRDHTDNYLKEIYNEEKKKVAPRSDSDWLGSGVKSTTRPKPDRGAK